MRSASSPDPPVDLLSVWRTAVGFVHMFPLDARLYAHIGVRASLVFAVAFWQRWDFIPCANDAYQTPDVHSDVIAIEAFAARAGAGCAFLRSLSKLPPIQCMRDVGNGISRLARCVCVCVCVCVCLCVWLLCVFVCYWMRRRRGR